MRVLLSSHLENVTAEERRQDCQWRLAHVPYPTEKLLGVFHSGDGVGSTHFVTKRGRSVLLGAWHRVVSNSVEDAQ
jgi:hypothetical protein